MSNTTIELQQPLTLQVSGNGRWGFWIPDTLKHGRVTLALSSGVTVELAGEDFENILALLGDTLQQDVAECRDGLKRLQLQQQAIQCFRQDLNRIGVEFDDEMVFASIDDNHRLSELEDCLAAFEHALTGSLSALEAYLADRADTEVTP